MRYLFQVHDNINLRYGCIGGFVLLENVILYHEILVNNFKKSVFLESKIYNFCKNYLVKRYII